VSKPRATSALDEGQGLESCSGLIMSHGATVADVKDMCIE
jgi:hypothetical protein